MNWLLSFFITKTPYDIARHELRLAKVHLMSVENDLEMYAAHKALLTKRIARLESFMDDDSRVKSEINWSTTSEVAHHAV